ncbi:MAG: metallophosphoesterase [Ekhidna sp.]|nr:metallophosphoesterase [Ekhidna sp.]
MRIQYASDLHLEFKDNSSYLNLHPLEKTGDILILAGDITYLQDSYFNSQIFDDWSKQYEQVYMICGNHEFYAYSFPVAEVFPSFLKEIRSNVHLVNNTSIDIEGTKFIFSTLFTRLDPRHSREIKASFNDFHQSEYEVGKKDFDPKNYDRCHTLCKAYIENELESLDGKSAVLVTHHVPYSSHNVPNYPFEHNGTLNSAFHVDLSFWFKKFNITHCISGHTHVNHEPITIHNTTCLTNQLGYVAWDEHSKFYHSAYFEI